MTGDDHCLPRPILELVMSIGWAKAFGLIKTSGFEDWVAFETPNTSVGTFIPENAKNLEFVMKCMS